MKEPDFWLDTNVNTTVIDHATLTAQDRCDACGAQAYVRVHLNAGQLYFCGHHAAQHLDALQDDAIQIDDERSRIAELD